MSATTEGPLPVVDEVTTSSDDVIKIEDINADTPVDHSVQPQENSESSAPSTAILPPRNSDTWSSVVYYATKVFHTLEYIGEVVADILGLNDSKYQWVIDGMDEEDWKAAREIQAKRERQNREHDESILTSNLESGNINPIDVGASTEIKE
eukprot:gene14234-30284_t